MRTAGLVCLGAGAGLIRADLRAVRGSDIVRRSGAVLVQVNGRRPRAVPVLARYHEALLASAKFAGDGLVTGGHDPARRNVRSQSRSHLVSVSVPPPDSVTGALPGGNRSLEYAPDVG